MTILLVEDNIPVARATKTLIENLNKNITVDIASDIATAREKIKTTSVKLLMIDFGLPDGNGLALIKYLREQGINTLIIGVTAHPEAYTHQEIAVAGLDEYIIKPLSRKIWHNITLKYQLD